ncbi:senescence-specific cysteine protease sag39 [Cucumis melo var. makuwa]|uniref:Senescence-specific cysteine protease sag39 n=1 Tax=Cucumis melo var. makuwa TaxID=1194695 RepID=A0A5D3CCT9_CUCMM|nr:senescence-specific cysteine protease sag39 [Cucumis melo var. makuwa]TYK09651.1 senescence-specific cysteine protease sag39 [Cucumis melo var. makuwa]
MSSANPSSKAQRDRLVELEEQMLYLVEVPDSIRFLESRLEEIAEKTNMIDAVAGRVEGLPIQELLARVDTLEGTVGRTGSHEHRDSSTDSVAHIEERVQSWIALKRHYVNARLSLTMRAMANQVPARGAIPISRVKIPKPKPFCGARDAKALKNYIFDLEQYFRPANGYRGSQSHVGDDASV